jgi:hypothetical protein
MRSERGSLAANRCATGARSNGFSREKLAFFAFMLV